MHEDENTLCPFIERNRGIPSFGHLQPKGRTERRCVSAG
jgi:hypothetical protein